MTGVSLAVIGICAAVAQMAVIGRFVKRFGERASLFSGIGFGALGMVGCGLAPNGWWFFLAIVPLCLWGLAPAAGQAMMTPPRDAARTGRAARRDRLAARAGRALRAR